MPKLPHLDIDDHLIRQRSDAARAELDETDEVDVGLDGPEEVELEEPAAIGPAAPNRHGGSAKPEEKDDPPLTEPANRVRRRGPMGNPDPAGLRAMLADQPELLEPGLSVYKSEKGTPLGISYTSAVGEIDLLARDANGGFVVVMIAEPHDGAELISGMLQRIGWVRKHLSVRSQSVRGIVLMDRPRDSFAYTATAVVDTVAFKTYQVALTFEDVSF